MMKCDRRWEVTNKYIYNIYILCYKPIDEFSLSGPYVGILGYVVGKISGERPLIWMYSLIALKYTGGLQRISVYVI